MTDTLTALLLDALGADAVLTDPADFDGHLRDMMPLIPAGQPHAVVLPTDTEQVQAVVRACASTHVPIVPRGAGSGLTGAANAVDGCVVLDTTRMNRILEIDPDNRLAVVEPGVVNMDLRTAVARHRLFYPPDPSSFEWCTLGGNIATNAGGLCCGKYGVTADAVLGLEAVLADGTLLRTGRRTVKGVAGYDLTRLLVGSEGTLGVITRATLALKPLPQAPSTLFATFDSIEAAGHAVVASVRAGVVPSLMEIMDATSLRACEKYLGTDLGGHLEGAAGCQALLLCQSDAGAPTARRELAVVEQVCRDAGADTVRVTDDLEEGRLFLAARRVCLTALEAQGACLTEDVAIPRTRIADLITGCARISERIGLPVAVVGHAGDGNMHPTVLYDDRTPGQLATAQQAFDEILALALSMGGTITGEHGVGRLKRDWLEREAGPIAMRIHRDIKRALDPGNLFNPGAMFTPHDPAEPRATA
ncbi:FAD-binding oxidoreductase [Streptomyces sp. H39-S7]|uniref:FAD-binding oxidoreductase n=1 Tax=Streptomyces sp. H39-S7 TaxID=3004357 RepID=UPI0022AFDF79|nr:FAD-linked oxidase C-terminal domain-containing protein [Streptomyces sp. H39-S7]MCZ4125220.1 FAD-binding protein [Streptomyces sp. H39-S7]